MTEKAKAPSPRWPVSVWVVLGVIFLLGWPVIESPHFFAPHNGGMFNRAWNAPITQDSIEQADAIVEGSFDLNGKIARSSEVYGASYNGGLDMNTFTLPFHVTGSCKGNPAATIQVKLAFPDVSRSILHWGLPLKEPMLLFLTRDPVKPDIYDLLAPQTGWLVIAHPHPAGSSAPDPAKFVVEDTTGFLQACLGNSKSGAIGYYTGLNRFLPDDVIMYPQTDPARQRALEIGKALANGDPDFLTLAQKYENEYGEIGRIARSIRADSGDYSDLKSRLNDYNTQPPVAPKPGQFAMIGDPKTNLPWEFSNAITGSEHLDKIMPLIMQALASPDQGMRLNTIRALSQRQRKDNGNYEKGNQLGNQFYPIMVKLLDDPDQEVQFSAMGCILKCRGKFDSTLRIGNCISGQPPS